MSLNTGHDWSSRMGNNLAMVTARAFTRFHARRAQRHAQLAERHIFWLNLARQNERELLEEYVAWENAR